MKNQFELSVVEIFHNIRINIKTELDPAFKAISLFDPDSTFFEPDILYILSVPDFVALGEKCAHLKCLLCSSNSSRLPKSMVSQPAFLAIAPDYSDVSQLYADCKQAFDSYHQYLKNIQTLMVLPSMNYSFNQLANAIAEVMNNPVAISSAGFKTLGFSSNIKTDDFVFNTYTKKNYSPAKYLNEVQESGLGKVFVNDTPQWNDKTDEYRRLGCKISLNGEMVGWFTIIESNEKLDDFYAMKLSAFAAKMLASEFKKNEGSDPRQWKPLNACVMDLFEQKKGSLAVKKEKAEMIQEQFPNGMHLVALKPQTASLHQYYFLLHELDFVAKGYFATQINSNVLLLINGTERECDSLINSEQFINSVKKYHLSIASGGYFMNALEIPKRFQLAVDALDIAKSLGAKPSNICYFEDYLIYYMLNQVKETLPLKIVIHPSVITMLKYDYTYSTKYTESLYVYFNTNAHMPSAAAKLNVHRNTLAYRLKKIDEEFKIDISNIKWVSKLLLSFRTLELMFGPDFTEHLEEVLMKLTIDVPKRH